MKKLLISAGIITLLQMSGMAQTGSIGSVVTDINDKTAVQGGTVSLLLQKDSTLVKTTTTNASGGFILDNLVPDSFIVTISSVGYQQYVSFITLNNNQRVLDTIRMEKQGTDLAVVTIVAKAPTVSQKGDTSQYSASQFKVNPDATTEDLIKKMPGITVEKDGTVTAQGEQVRKVTVDGKDFFGDDASAALRNLPSEVVDKIQVFDRLSDQAQLTGFDDGNAQRSINIVTKSGIKNGQFGRIYGGYGTDERYSAGGNVSFFKGARRFSVVANFNNINQQNFASQDLLGVTSTGNSGGGGGRPGGGGGGRPGGGGSDNFNVGQASGISRTNAFGINFGNQWGPKATVTASYFFNNSLNKNRSTVNREFINSVPKQFDLEENTSETNNTNHRFNARLEYKFDSANSLFIIPNISFQTNNSKSLGTLQSYTGNNDSLTNSLIKNLSDRNGYNIRNNMMYRHSFAKRGRTISFGLNTTFSKNNSETQSDGFYRFYDGGLFEDSIYQNFYDNVTNGNTIGANVSYTEPLSKLSQLQLSYSPSIQKSRADQKTFRFDGQKYSVFDTSLSNRFDNTNTTNNAGLSYRYNPDRDQQFSAGINFQSTKLESDRIFPTKGSVDQTFTNLLPNLMWRKKISTYGNIRVFYRASTTFPTVNQLQDVINNSNALRISVGNPQLKQSYANVLSGRYTYTNTRTSRSFFANVFLQAASDYITNSVYIASKDSLVQEGIELKKGGQLTKPVNMDGYKSLRTLFTYSMPVTSIKTNLNVNAGFNYSKLPGLQNDLPVTTDNFVYNAGLVLASNISEFVDYNVSYNWNLNDARTNSSTASDNRYINQSIGVQLNLLNKKGWFIQNDLSHQRYSGLLSGEDQNYTLWNAGIGKKFLKNKAGELKLTVFDLLKQNQSVVRTVTSLNIEDVNTEVLTQYFMLTFTYSLKNFGVTAQTNNRGQNRRVQGTPERNAGGL